MQKLDRAVEFSEFYLNNFECPNAPNAPITENLSRNTDDISSDSSVHNAQTFSAEAPRLKARTSLHPSGHQAVNGAWHEPGSKGGKRNSHSHMLTLACGLG